MTRLPDRSTNCEPATIGSCIDRTENLLRHSTAMIDVAKPPPDRDQIQSDLAHVPHLLKRFVLIPIADFAQHGQFLIQHPAVRQVAPEGLFKEAVEYMITGDTRKSQAWIQSLAMLKVSEKVDVMHLATCFQRMRDSNTREGQLFSDMVTDFTAEVQKSAAARVDGARAPWPAIIATAIRDRRPSSSNGANSHAQGSSPNVPVGWSDDAAKSKTGINNTCTHPLSQAALRPALQPDPPVSAEMQSLSSKYRVRQDGVKFFRPGRVFAILWHESAGQVPTMDNPLEPQRGDVLGPNMTRGPYGETIYSHIRRMVVIKNRRGYCWCIPISSYSGQGLRRRGLRQDDINSHTIVHDSRKDPQYLSAEPHSTKLPIAVDVIPGHSLSQAARLHYAKPHTVDWNTKVMDVGVVLSRCIPILLSDVGSELLGNPSRSRW